MRFDWAKKLALNTRSWYNRSCKQATP
jgi:hypothetical protein